MTACVNNEKEIKGGVSGKVLRTVAAGVLAMSMMPAAALAVEPADAAVLAAESELDTWQEGTFTWSAEADEYGTYTVSEGDVFSLESVTDVFGNEVPVGDYTVLYFKDNGNTAGSLDQGDDFVTAAESINGVKGGMPENELAAGYFAVALKTPIVDAIISNDGVVEWNNVVNQFKKAGVDLVWKAQKFYVKAEKATLEGAFPYDSKVSDTSFKYGTDFSINFADAEGNPLTKGSDYAIAWVGTDPTDAATYEESYEIPAGTYTAVLTGLNKYAGTQETVDVVVNAIDLATDTVSIDVKAKTDSSNNSYAFDALTGVLTEDNNTVIKVNGEAVNASILQAKFISSTDKEGTVSTTAPASVSTEAKISLAVSEQAANNASVKGSAKIIDAYLVTDRADVLYDDEALFADNTVFNAAKGDVFDVSLVGAVDASGDAVPFTPTVTKDGVEVDTFTEPGEYTLTVDVKAPANLAYAAHEDVTFIVANGKIGTTTVYAAVDGKTIDQGIEYDGEAVVPTVVVKEGTKVLSADKYDVKYYAEKYDAVGDIDEKDLVDSMVEPGDYTVVIDYKNALNKADSRLKDPDFFTLTIDKATIESAEADTAVYPYTGETVSPTFTGYTDEDLQGTAVALDPKVTGVRYFKAVDTDNDGKIDIDADGKWVQGAEVAASNLKAEGKYVAEISVSSTDPHYQGAGVQATFEISKEAGFTDVSSTDWFADSVYKAKELGYIDGIQGTTLFAPNADIDRSQIASIMFKMAGGSDKEAGTGDQNEYPTKFSDVDQAAWYAQAVAWASTYGVVNGYAGTDLFGTFDKATREQVATMFYNYAKAMGQDVAVADVDAALAKVSDPETVSEWAKPAVAWAIENGVMGNGGSIMAQNNITRAEVAAMAVNFQPEKL